MKTLTVGPGHWAARVHVPETPFERELLERVILAAWNDGDTVAFAGDDPGFRTDDWELSSRIGDGGSPEWDEEGRCRIWVSFGRKDRSPAALITGIEIQPVYCRVIERKEKPHAPLEIWWETPESEHTTAIREGVVPGIRLVLAPVETE